MGVTSGGKDLEGTVFDGQVGDVERFFPRDDAELVGTTGAFVDTVGGGGGGGFVGHTQDVETGNSIRVLGGMTPGIIEGGMDSDGGMGDLIR